MWPSARQMALVFPFTPPYNMHSFYNCNLFFIIVAKDNNVLLTYSKSFSAAHDSGADQGIHSCQTLTEGKESLVGALGRGLMAMGDSDGNWSQAQPC